MRNTVFALCLLAVATPAAAATNLIQNGDFTLLTNGVGQITDGYNITTATSWTTTGYNFVMSVADHGVPTQYKPATLSLWDHANGGVSTWNGTGPTGNFLAMDADYLTARVSQTVSGLKTGGAYTVSFYYAFAQQYTYAGDTTQALSLFVGNAITAAWTSATFSLPTHDFSGWIKESFTFTATGPSEVVSFLASGSPAVPPFTLVSDVTLEDASAPAPVPGAGVLSLAFFAIVVLRSQAKSFLRSAYGRRRSQAARN